MRRRTALFAPLAMATAAPALLAPAPALAQAVDTMPIATYLQLQGNGNLAQGAAAVAAYLRSAAATHAGIRYFNLGWDWPDQLVTECARNGIATVGEFNGWCARKAGQVAHSDVAGLEGLIGKVPEGLVPANMPSVPVGTLHTGYIVPAMRATGGVCQWMADSVAYPRGDATKRLPTDAQVDQLLLQYPGARNPFIAVDNDCDKSTANFMGFLMAKRLGMLAFSTCWLRMLNQGQQLPVGHVVLIVVTTTGVWFLEPQDRKRYPLQYTRFNGYRSELGQTPADTMQVVRVEI